MSRVTERPYLSIGEVLGLLLEEFSDVTISKIRFLESQGLIEPERTASGYRKFYDADVERLRVILREQRQNFLPLRVIRDRLESGAIESDPSDPVVIDIAPPPIEAGAPRGIRNVVAAAEPPAEISTATHPTATHAGPGRPPAVAAHDGHATDGDAPPSSAGSLTRSDVCSQAGLTDDELGELEAFGVLTARTAPAARYTPADVAIARAAAGFLRHGIDARHLRSWRISAEREAALFEQRILPLLRQRNPRARHDATQTLTELSELGASLRCALVAEALRPHLDG